MYRSIWSSLLVAFGLRVEAQEVQTVNFDSGRSVIHITNFQSRFIEARNIDIYLPPSYNGSIPYRVLYIQDGQNVFNKDYAFENEALDLDLCLQHNNVNDVIIVAIWNTSKRFREYLIPDIFDELSKKDKRSIKREYGGAPLGDRYLSFLVEELIPYVESNYNTSKQSSDRFIGGISMGAFISFCALIKYPEVFGSGLCLSTHWPLTVFHDRKSIPDKYLKFVVNNKFRLSKCKIYLDYGTENIDSWYEYSQLKILDILQEVSDNYEKNILSLEFKGAGHSMKDWKNRINLPVRFIFKNEYPVEN